jgi:hypothetical protein
MIDLRNHTYQMIKRLKWVDEDLWWEKSKDKPFKSKFKNVLKQTFYYNCKNLPIKLYQHKIINLDRMNLVMGGSYELQKPDLKII